MWFIKFNILPSKFWGQNINKVFLFISIFIFFVGIIIGQSFNDVQNFNSIEKVDGFIPKNKIELFSLIFENNIIIYFLLIAGFITFSLSSTFLLLYNGFIFGYCLNLISLNELLIHFFPHAILESFAYILAYYISLRISKILYSYFMESHKKPLNFKYETIYIFIGVLTIFFSAIIESYVSIK